MTTTKFNKYIKIIEDKLNLTLSDEQKAILKYNYKTPVRLNACAGAGKTTLLIISMIMQILDGTSPDDMLAITFSKKSQLDMQAKYDQVIGQLGVQPPGKPTIRTFDALFYRLLKSVDPNLRVLPTSGPVKQRLNWAMKNAIKVQPEMISQTDLLEQIDEFYNQMINRQVSYDGLTSKQAGKPYTEIQLQSIGNDFNYNRSLTFYKNYISVINTYQQTKAQQNYVDFTDMKLNLFKAMGNSKSRKIIEDQMAHFKICFIDEFQDINALQWSLINTILPQSAKDHLATIGDDDQSIYTFRGSNPDIIMNLDQKVANLKTFNLTTNYRTAGNILNKVTPAIQHNQYRLDKPLNVSEAKTGQGKLINFVGNQYADGSELLLDDVNAKLANPKIADDQIAILCRNNLDVSLASDYLANHGHYTNVNRESNILQNQPLYHTLATLMWGLYTDNFESIYQNAVKIGFSKYQKHMQQVLHEHDVNSVKSLSKYLQWATKYNAKHLDRNDYQDKQLLDSESRLRMAYESISMYDAKMNAPIGEIMHNTIMELTRIYYTYMTKNQFQDKATYEEITRYLQKQLQNVTDLDAFFKQETTKLNALHAKLQGDPNTMVDDHCANFMTIHQAKGLEFEYVYAYNMRANNVKPWHVTINRHFAPNMTRQDCIEKLLSDDMYVFETARDCGWLMSFAKRLRQAKKNRSKPKLLKLLTVDPNELTTMSEFKTEFEHVYEELCSISRNVEDERRLIYVALTRSIKEAYYNVDYDGPRTTTPLYDEIEPDMTNVYESDKDLNVINQMAIYENKDYDVDDLDDFRAAFK